MGIKSGWIVIATGIGFLALGLKGAVIGLILGIPTNKIVWAAIKAIPKK
jgi:hypothetical protein